MILNHLFAFTLLTILGFQFKSFYERSECVQDFQKESIKIVTQKLLEKESPQTHNFLSCKRIAFYKEKKNAQQSSFAITNQKLTLGLEGKLRRP